MRGSNVSLPLLAACGQIVKDEDHLDNLQPTTYSQHTFAGGSNSGKSRGVSWKGIALTEWQDIEDLHYILFSKLLGAPKPQICSILYHSSPSFEARRVLVDRIANEAIADKRHLKEWREINKRLNDGAFQRGKIAHFRLGVDIVRAGPSGDDISVTEIRLDRLCITNWFRERKVIR